MILYAKGDNMLLNYSIKNYKSYRFQNELTFVASKIKEFEENNITNISKSLISKNRILNSIVFVGANSAGKTNILKSISYARYLILNSAAAMKDKENIFEDPDIFMFDEQAENEPTEFYIEFTTDDNKSLYSYSFSFCRGEILSETLSKRESNEKDRLSSKKVLFERQKNSLIKSSEQFARLSQVI